MKNVFWGCVIVAIGLVSGRSVFLGDFGAFNIFFDGLGTYWIASGLLSLRRRDAPAAPQPVAGSIAEAASRMLANLQSMYGRGQGLVPVGDGRFTNLDERHYTGFRKALESRGFRFLGEFVLPHVNQSPTTLVAPTKISACASRDGQVVAEYYQVKPRIGRRLKALARGLLNLRWIAAPKNFFANLKMRHCIGFETEFSDGTFMTTSNAAAAGMMSLPSTIESRFLPQETKLRELLRAHEARLHEIASAAPARVPAPVTDSDSLLQMQRRLSLQKAAHRAAVDWVTRSELEAFSGGRPELAEQLFAEVQRQLQVQRTQR